MGFNIKKYLHDFTTEDEIKNRAKERMCEYFACRHASLVANGTVAIEIVLKALKLPRGTGVIVPDISFIATATAVANCGLIPVYADVSEEYFGMTLEGLKSKFSEDIGAVIVVHFAGFMNREIFRIKEFCDSKGIYLIEDCAQVFPCSIDGKRAGTIGDASTFSFQSSKIVNSGEGGMILTGSEEIGAACEAVLNWGLSHPDRDNERDLNVPSGNYRLSAVQAYLILKQMDMIDEIVSERLKMYDGLTEACGALGVTPALPRAHGEISDCPFFFPVKSSKKINTLAPVGEYPMRNSSIVKAILTAFYPELLEKYRALNGELSGEWASDRVLKGVDLINLSKYAGHPFEEILKPYIPVL